MSEILATTTDQDKHETAFIADAETNEQDINIENVEAKHQLALNILKLADNGNSRLIYDYFLETLDNKTEAATEERSAIFEFASNQQRIEIKSNLVKKQEEVIEKLGYQSKQSNYLVCDGADNLLRRINITNQDMDKNVNAKLRYSDNAGLALLGLEPVLVEVKSSEKVVDEVNERLINSNRSKKETIQDYKLDLDHGTEKQHLEALDIIPSENIEGRELSPLIDKDVLQKATQKITDAIREAKANGKSSEEAVLSLLNEKPKESSTDTINEINIFIQKMEKLTDTESGELKSILQKTGEIKSRLNSYIETATKLLNDSRIHPEIAISMTKKLRVDLGTASQLSYTLRRDLDRLISDENHILHIDEISMPQTSKASLFK